MDVTGTTLKPKSLTANHRSFALDGLIMLCSVTIALTAVLILFCFHTYARWLSVSHDTRRRRHGAAGNRRNLLPLTADGNALQGLDLSILKALPTFVYSSKTHEPLQECAVCLSGFQEDEKGRVLPRCEHTFHVDCIDMWLHSHSNCPTCRITVQPENITGAPEDVTAATVAELTSSEPEIRVDEECGVVCSSSGCSANSSPVRYQRKPSELVGL